MRVRLSAGGKDYEATVSGNDPLSDADLDALSDSLGVPKNVNVKVSNLDSQPSTPTTSYPTYDPQSIKYAADGGGIGAASGAVAKAVATPEHPIPVGPSQMPSGNLPESDFTRALAQSAQLQHAQSMAGYNEANTPPKKSFQELVSGGQLQSAIQAGRAVATKQAKRQAIIDANKRAEGVERLRAGTAAANPLLAESDQQARQMATNYGQSPIKSETPSLGGIDNMLGHYDKIFEGFGRIGSDAVHTATDVGLIGFPVLKNSLEQAPSNFGGKSALDDFHKATDFLSYSIPNFGPAKFAAEIVAQVTPALMKSLAMGSDKPILDLKDKFFAQFNADNVQGAEDAIGMAVNAALNGYMALHGVAKLKGALGKRAGGVSDAPIGSNIETQTQSRIRQNEGLLELPQNAGTGASSVLANHEQTMSDLSASAKQSLAKDRLNQPYTYDLDSLERRAIPPSFDAFVAEHGKTLLEGELNAIDSLRARGNLPSSDPDFAGLTREDIFHLKEARKEIIKHQNDGTLPDYLIQHLKELHQQLVEMYRRTHGLDPLIYGASQAATAANAGIPPTTPAKTRAKKTGPATEPSAPVAEPIPQVPASEPVAPLRESAEGNTPTTPDAQPAPDAKSAEPTVATDPSATQDVGVNNRTMKEMERRGEIEAPEPNKLPSLEDRNAAAAHTTVDDALATVQMLRAHRSSEGFVDTAEATSKIMAGMADATRRIKDLNEHIVDALESGDHTEAIKLKAERDALQEKTQELANAAKEIPHKEFAGIGHALQGARDVSHIDRLSDWHKLGPEVKADFKSANNAEMPPQLEAKLKEHSDTIKDQSDRISVLERKLSVEKAEENFEAEKEGTKRKVARDKATLDAERQDILQQLEDAGGIFESKGSPRNRQGGSVNIPINIEAARIIKALAKNLIESGVGTLEDVVNKIVELAPHLAKNYVMEALAHTEKRPTQSEVSKLKQDIMREARNQVEAQKKIAALDEQIKNGPWEETAKTPKTPTSKELAALRFQRDVTAKALEAKINSMKKRSVIQKAADAYRFGVLTSFTSFGRLNLAAILRLPGTAAEELVGAALRHIPGVKGIAAKAPHEGYSGLSAEKDAAMQRLSGNAYKEAWNVARHGYNSVSAELGGTQKEGFESIPGRLHESAKTPTFMADYSRRLNQAMQHAKANGVDTENPAINWGIRKEAHDYALRSKSAQDNAISSTKQNIIKAKPWTEPIFTFLSPVEKIATNLAIERAESSPAGLGAGVYRTIMQLHEGVDNLSPKDADITMRLLKKGAKGTALFYLGYKSASSVINGQHLSKDEYFNRLKQLNDALEGGGEGHKLGDTKIGWAMLPHWAMEHVADLAMIQYGGYFAAMERQREREGEHSTAPSAAQTLSNIGVNAAQTSPAIDAPFTAYDLATSDYARMNKLGSLVPGGIRWSAKIIDELHNPTNRGLFETLMNPGPARKATTPGEKIKEQFPVMREQLRRK